MFLLLNHLIWLVILFGQENDPVVNSSKNKKNHMGFNPQEY